VGVGEADDRVEDVAQLQREILLLLVGLLGFVAGAMVEQARQLARFLDEARQVGERGPVARFIP